MLGGLGANQVVPPQEAKTALGGCIVLVLGQSSACVQVPEAQVA
jgi:hypothetical protein